MFNLQTVLLHCYRWSNLSTSEALSAQIPLLDEAGEHLGLHEHLQEPSQALGSDRFAKGLALEGRGGGRRRGARQGWGGDRLILSLCSTHEEGVVTHHLHKETHKGLRHHRAEGAGVWVEVQERKPAKKRSEKKRLNNRYLLPYTTDWSMHSESAKQPRKEFSRKNVFLYYKTIKLYVISCKCLKCPKCILLNTDGSWH